MAYREKISKKAPKSKGKGKAPKVNGISLNDLTRLPYIPGKGMNRQQMLKMLRDPDARRLYGAGSGGGGGGKKPKKKPPKFNPVYGNTMARVYGNAPAVRMPTPPPRPAPRAPVDPITAQLEALYGPEQEYLQNLIKSQTEQANAAQLRRQALNQSYAQWYSQHVPGQIQGIYSQAGQDQSAFAKGFSDGMQHIQQQGAGSANDIMKLAGAPQGQMIQPNADAADVLYGTGGYIPASTFSREGAAFASAASLMPGAIVAQGQAQAAKDRSASDANIAKLEDELSKLMTKKAEAGLKLREARRAEKLKIQIENAKLRAKGHGGIDAAASKVVGALVYDDGSLVRDRKGKPIPVVASSSGGTEGHPISSTLSKERGYYVDTYGNAVLDKNGNTIPYHPPATGSGKKGGVKGKGYTDWSTSQGVVRVYDDGRTKVIVPSGKGPGGSAKPLTAKERSDAVVGARQGIKEGMSFAEVMNDIPEWGIDVAQATKIAARQYGMKFVNGHYLYTKSGLWKMIGQGSGGFNAVRKAAIELGFQPSGHAQKGEIINYILAHQGKGSAAPSGGRQNAAFVQGHAILPATFTPTHQTDGLPGYPATDYMLPAGSTVGAPISGTIQRVHHTQPGNPKVYGWIMYLVADNGDIYFLTHFDNVFVKDGQRVQRGSPLGTVAPYGSASHIHIGIHRNRSV